MSGGAVISLVAYGVQDKYISGEPEVSFFKIGWKRHTNFACETIELPLDTIRFGGRSSVLIQRNADLINGMCLRVTTPVITSDLIGATTKVAWVRRLGHALVRDVQIVIGGSVIDEHTGVWLDIYYELTHLDSKQKGYLELIGDSPELTELSGVDSNLTGVYPVVASRDVYVPLQFWFCRNNALALPLIALSYHDVRLNFDFESINKLICWTSNSVSDAPRLSSLQIVSAGLLVDYVYLDVDERRGFSQMGHSYLIEQLQYNDSLTLPGNSSTVVSTSLRIDFNHPTKEIIWALKVGAFNGNSSSSSFINASTSLDEFLTYTHLDDWSSAVDNAARNLVEGAFSTTVGAAGTAVPLVSGTPAVALGTTYVTLYSGTVVTIIDNTEGVAVLKAITTSKLFFNSNTDLMLDIASATLVINANGSIKCTDVVHTLLLNDVSIPVSSWTDNRYSHLTNDTTVRAHNDVHVIQPSNYGMRLDGRGNPVSLANIKMNGHDRFSQQPGIYFNKLVPLKVHTRTPADGINVYSFALNPEKYQPSGSTNLSRIDNTVINLTVTDPLRVNSQFSLDFTTNTNIYIFAVNYNLLRILGGMAGIAFSS